METKVLPADQEGIAAAVKLLEAGEVVAFPTETVYGLGGPASRGDSIQAIFAAKGRPSTDPLILHLPDPDLARAVADGWVASPLPKTALLLAKSFWPGPLTLILQRGSAVHPEMTAKLETVAVRCPSHPAARKLLKSFGSPLAAPSANRFGRISPTDAAAVLQELGGRIPLILDGGPCSVGLESTVINLIKPIPEILRPGGITMEQISATLGRRPTLRSGFLQKEESQTAPGQLASHYAPATPLYLCDTPIQNLAPESFHILFSRSPKNPAAAALVLGADGDPGSVARELYRALRIADASGAKKILVEPVPDGIWAEAVRDRLARAASGTAHWRGKGWEVIPRQPA